MKPAKKQEPDHFDTVVRKEQVSTFIKNRTALNRFCNYMTCTLLSLVTEQQEAILQRHNHGLRGTAIMETSSLYSPVSGAYDQPPCDRPIPIIFECQFLVGKLVVQPNTSSTF